MDDLVARRDALRQARSAPGADPRTLLEAALTELDGAIDALDEAGGHSPAGGLPAAQRAERRLLKAAFGQAPAALALLTPDGVIRRASNRAAALLGAPAGYATGKPLTVFVDLPQRAAVQTQLAAVARTGQERRVSCRMVTPDGLTGVTLAIAAITLPGDPPVLAVTITPDGPAPDRKAAERGRAESGDAPAAREVEVDGHHVASMARRLDTVTAMTRLLLDNATFSEAVTIQRCARLLAGELADWVIVDLARPDAVRAAGTGGVGESALRRQIVTGPRGPKAEAVARAVRGVAPGPSTLPGQVHASGKSVLLAHAADPAALGSAADGTPVLMTLRAASLLVVPIAEETPVVGETKVYGTLTLVRRPPSGHFTVADLGLAEDLCGHLATAMRVDEVFRRRSERAEALQASLLPERLPRIPGLEFAASYIGANKWHEIAGDFYDVFPVPSGSGPSGSGSPGWALAIGDVSGIGQQAAAMTAAARHSIRALAHVHHDPVDVLAAAGEVLTSPDYEERYVTAMLAFPEAVGGDGGRCRLRLASAGHPGPAIVRADGRVEILTGDGFPLGLLPPDWLAGARPSRMDLDLGPGDVLLLYTDGVSQAANENSEFFDDRLADALAATAGRSAAETVSSVSEQLTDFCRGEFRDDVTMLAMRVSGEEN